MSFFANLLGGTLQGVGAGMSSMAADEERLARERALIQERSQAALELQQQRAQDRLYQQQEMAALKASAGGGAGGGGKGINLAAMAMQAKTPEEQDQVIRLTKTFGGRDTGRLLADEMFNRPEMVGTPASAGDFARYDRAGDMQAAPPKGAMERAAYDRDQGQLGLQRLYTAFLDPGKLDGHARGERQFGINDRGTANAAQAMPRGGSLPEAPAAFQRYPGSSMDDSERNPPPPEAGDVPGTRTGVQAGPAGMRNAWTGARALDGAALAPALNDYQPGATTRAPSPTAVLPSPNTSVGAGRYAAPKSLADAWRAKVGVASK